jgi:RND superfamily putative drug exporter
VRNCGIPWRAALSRARPLPPADPPTEPPKVGRWVLPALLVLVWLVLGDTRASYRDTLSEIQSNDPGLFLPAGAESTTVQKLQERFAKNRLLVTVVVFERKSGLTDADNAAIQAKAAELAQAPGLDGAISRPFPSEDGKAAQILLPVCGADPYRATGSCC